MTGEVAQFVCAILMGRLANGSALDAGSVVHLVPAGTGQYSPTAEALCGRRPGRTSGGWDVEFPARAEVSCDRCERKFIKIAGGGK